MEVYSIASDVAERNDRPYCVLASVTQNRSLTSWFDRLVDITLDFI